MGMSLEESLTDHLRGNYVPPLPVEYVAWAVELLPSLVRAEREARDYGDTSFYDEMVKVPDAIVASGTLPREVEYRDDGPYVRQGDMVAALHLEGYVGDALGDFGDADGDA